MVFFDRHRCQKGGKFGTPEGGWQDGTNMKNVFAPHVFHGEGGLVHGWIVADGYLR